MYQQKMLEKDGHLDRTKIKDFIVMDMETVRDYSNKHFPYEIALVICENGKLRIVTETYNNHVFQGDFDEPDKYLQRFIDDQTAMYRKTEPEITDEEIMKRIKYTVNRIKQKKNEPTFVSTIAINKILESAQCPIVAHNGDRFDFINFDNLMLTLAKRTLKNKVFDILYKDKEAAVRRFGEVEGKIDLSKIPDETLKKVISNFMKKPPVKGSREYSAFAETITKIFELRIKNFVELQFEKAAKACNYTYDKETFDKLFTDADSPYIYLCNYIYDYLYEGKNKKTVVDDIMTLCGISKDQA